ncbi:MAG: M15 family metallopeptidase [Clostridia bacterium]|nr:M15 family metallopeptidase [Clostridia bacterium]
MTEYNVAVKYKPKLAIKTIIITFIILVMLIKIISMTNLELFNNVKNKAMLIINPIDIESVSTVDDSWQLMLINSQNPIPDDFQVELMTVAGELKVDKRIYPYLQNMFKDAKNAGILPSVSSAYRTKEQQQSLFNEEMKKHIDKGCSYQKAVEEAKSWVAIPGTSEHQTGLAVDITSINSATQNPSLVWEWLSKNSYKYGFILRYPENKTKITRINFEPWHFRYVGKAAAAEIFNRGICLEEYLDIINEGVKK